MLFEKVPVRRLSHFVIAYMILAFGWWSYHLWEQNDRLFDAEKRALELRFTKQNQGVNLTQLLQTAEYKKIDAAWCKERRMVVAEGIFFTFCLIFGLWVIRTSANRETQLARQRRNFMLSITHELKSPIASVRLVLETLGKRELRRDQLEMLCTNGLKDATRLQNLVEDLLLAARLENNWQPHTEPVDLATLAQEAAARLAVRFPHADMDVQVPPGLPLIQADKSGLTSVVQNLLENAIKYSPEGARVQFSAEQITGGIRFRVADQGQGIPESERTAVFEKFYRLGNEETRSATGTGLGLYIVRQVVQAHSGSIQISENKPKGTVFTVEL